MLSLSTTDLRVGLDETTATYAIADIATLQHRKKNRRGMAAGALFGAAGGLGLGVLLPAWVEVPDKDKLGYALAASAGGALIGAAAGSGRTGRRVLLLGSGAGFVLGAIILSGACESDSPALCPVVYGGGFGVIFGSSIGSGIGLALPNWVNVEGTGLTLSF